MKIFILLLTAAVLFFGCTDSNTQTVSSSSQSNAPINNQISTQTAASSSQLAAQEGDVVLVDYVGRLEDGEVFDTSIREEAQAAGLRLRNSYQPMQFVVGEGRLIDGFEEGVIGMREGEERNVTILPEKGYGETRQDLIVAVNRSELTFEGHESIGIGAELEAANGLKGTVIETTNETITVDFNHPLAGKTLSFQIIVRSIYR